jgi:sugar O-acyltransferase (sialic acid O-acetyltransferase NeuD family)
MQDLIILGTGGNCLDIVDAVQAINEAATSPRYRVLGFLDDNPASHGTNLGGLPVLGPLKSAASHAGCQFVNGIGSTTNFWKKPAIIGQTGLPLDRFETILDPSARVSRYAEIGRGTVLLQNVTVNARARIGVHVIVLPGAVISHDCVFGDYGCVASSASLAGGVEAGEACYLGANCTVMSNVKLGRHSLVGMGAVVLKSAEERSVLVGNPARWLRSTH